MSVPVIVAIALGTALSGFSKTGIPVAGMLAATILAGVLGPTAASGFLVPLLIVGDLIALALYRQHADWGLIRRITPGVLGGFLLAGLGFWLLPVPLLTRLLGALLLVAVGLEAWRIRTSVEAGAQGSGWVAAATFGSLAGVTTMAANAGSAALTIYLVKMRVPVLAFMGTSAWFFAILNVLKVPVILALGLTTWSTLGVSAMFLPALLAGAALGWFLVKRVDRQRFTRIGLILSALGATWLLVHG